MSISIAVIGECMLELTHAQKSTNSVSLPLNMNFGGDTLNTSIYLSREQTKVSYVTALGDDVTSDWLIDEWRKEGIDCSLIQRMPNSVPGMYMVNVDEHGERSFLYWRKGSPASRMFDNPDTTEELFGSLAAFTHLYLSGISLAILSTEACGRLLSHLENFRANGGKLIFDGNYRPNLWESVPEARGVYTQMYRMSDIALPTFEDEQQLFGYPSAEDVMQAIRDFGVTEVVVKMGADGCLALQDEVVDFVAAESVNPVDTTAAGDSFNAGYLSARLKGNSVIDSCRAGHALAGEVIQHRGAIIR